MDETSQLSTYRFAKKLLLKFDDADLDKLRVKPLKFLEPEIRRCLLSWANCEGCIRLLYHSVPMLELAS